MPLSELVERCIPALPWLRENRPDLFEALRTAERSLEAVEDEEGQCEDVSAMDRLRMALVQGWVAREAGVGEQAG